MRQDGEQTSDSSGSAWAARITQAGSLAVLYVLSIGPVVAITKSNPATVATVQAIYYPVRWLHEHTPLKRPLEVYASFWSFD